MIALILAVIWCGALWRLWMALRRPSTHRNLLANAAVGMAVATTLYLLRDDLDSQLGIPNLSLLLMRIVGIYAGMTGLLYLREVGSFGPRRRLIVGISVTAMGLLAVAWVFTPIHATQLSDIATLPRGWATVYGAVLYLYAAWVFTVCARTAFQHAREVRRTDPAGAAATALIAAASVVALLIIVLFLGNLLAGRPWLHSIRTALVPIPAVLLIVGVVAIPLAAPVIRWFSARATIRRTEPLWNALVSHHPEVQLPMPATSQFSRTLRAERRLIEIADSLEQHTTPRARSIPELAHAVLAPPDTHGEPARSVLLRIDDSPWPAPVLRLADAITDLTERRP